MTHADVLILTALPKELKAAKAAGAEAGIASWSEEGRYTDSPYWRGDLLCGDGRKLSVALARPTRMGSRSLIGPATELTRLLRPRCLAMTGVCAGHPERTAFGDVIVAEVAYDYGEGKLGETEFSGDHRQYKLNERWLFAAQDFEPDGLPSHGAATVMDAAIWFLERLLRGQDPAKHPARARYFPRNTWAPRLEAIAADGLIVRDGSGYSLTPDGREYVERVLFDDVDGPSRLPFAVVTGPMASGSAVRADGRAWQQLAAMGMRSIVGLEMEGAALATVAQSQKVPEWVVVKGVMDHADGDKDDRFKEFAATASAEVLFALLDRLGRPAEGGADEDVTPTAGAEGGKYHVTITNAHGVQIGDRNVQWNEFR
ncbi:hypothetical protein Val02_28750 [Virgisporangium aliadipatigenens]|uniref:Nucleoside phosphorylase domain-containing protein n=1 Tax=Virgisporangium aliadipatigenens TaxID=741659 RepID=A0A8J3YIK3_9ACTN|nr:RIP homotypic interaction motif-containing protein [Virgisporangium aliadipatigenens]GIJ45989.1 hypothetical protein Val02_28750 [Virgisporangium aliadipatigenens]